MALMDFIKKQFIDIIQWTEDDGETRAWRFPMAEMEIQNGASLTVRESQMAVFVNEGQVADVFGPGMYKLTTQTLPVLTYLKNWDKLFQSPFKSDVYFFSTRQQLDRRWGTTQPVTIRDKDFGAVRLRGFGNYAYAIADAKLFHTSISGTRDRYTVEDLDGQLRGLMLQHISDAVAQSGVPFLDLAANQVEFAKQLREEGQDLREAAIKAARLRLRPILMTSLAFALGVVPLMLASGASSETQHAIGTGVFGGMVSGTVLAVFFVPVFFVVVRSLFRGSARQQEMNHRHAEEAGVGTHD